MTDAVQRREAWQDGDAAASYERTRPGYPRAAVDWVLAGAGRPVGRVLDVGAGTGKLTRTLLELGLAVVAVDPSAGMLGVLEAALPGVEYHLGAAEQVPLADDSVDAVVCGQAWHWVDPARALPEVARVVRPGGVFGVLWNLRDERIDWVAALGDALDSHEDTAGSFADRPTPPVLGASFGPPEVELFEHAQLLAPADLPRLASSRSDVLIRDPADRERVLARVADLARTHPDLAGRDVVELPYRTVAWRARVTP
ncbi:MAG: class I SAM-dependent methyltransferase [Mycobacteriales bacterium]